MILDLIKLTIEINNYSACMHRVIYYKYIQVYMSIGSKQKLNFKNSINHTDHIYF